ncbi:maltose ABC transporter substrate-binding protein [Embleya scabrispora]|uniref:Maltose ABC transporter substrate-binding protein n=1 Tax=Embleya scabrispora TaxID=159449 RepID=A0A1T3NN31_9ACTN|nr:maltose ABC transporter substrate-binding protein [Embleya scabrispora]OPC78267.1 maltose ABC transporter substrate-binding protein [Embleya scabrispora]
MRPRLLLPAVLAAATLLATACGGGGGDKGDDKTAPPASAPAAGNGSLTVWADDARAKPLQDIAAAFTRDKGVKIKVVQKGLGEIRDDFVSQAPTGQGPDVVVGPHDWLGKLVHNGVLAPLELGDRAAAFSPVALEAMRYEGRTYGLPYAVDSIALLRNTDLAPQAPASFDELLATGRRLVEQGRAELPVAVPVDAKSGSPYHLYPLQTSFGCRVFGTKPDGAYDQAKLELDSPGCQRFGPWLRGLGKDGVLSTSLTADIATDAFLKGKTPFLLAGPWDAATFRAAHVPFAVDPVPSVDGSPARPFVGVQGFFVGAKSANPILAQDFVLNYLSTPQAQRALYDTGGRVPATTAVLEQVGNDPVVAGFARAAQAGLPTPNLPAMDSVWADWGLTQLAIIQGHGDPGELTSAMAGRIRAKIVAG